MKMMLIVMRSPKNLLSFLLLLLVSASHTAIVLGQQQIPPPAAVWTTTYLLPPPLNSAGASGSSFCQAAGMLGLYGGGPICVDDAQCQQLATGYFCYQGRCCTQTPNSGMMMPPGGGGGYGSACALDSQCLFPNAQCKGGVCYCRPDSNYNGQDCIPRAAYDPFPPTSTTMSLGWQQCGPGQLYLSGLCYPLTNYYGYCDYTGQCAFPGGVCIQKRCVCPLGTTFDGLRCMSYPGLLLQDTQQQPPPLGTAPCLVPNYVRVDGGLCLPLRGEGEPCLYDAQCQVGAAMMTCVNSICRRTFFEWRPGPAEIRFPVCRNPNAEVELLGAIPKDCIYQRCSPGFHCEYNARYKGGQYICCGISFTNPFYGQPKMYPGNLNLPLQCTAINSCTFIDYPHCTYSESYRHKVCCSKPKCI